MHTLAPLHAKRHFFLHMAMSAGLACATAGIAATASAQSALAPTGNFVQFGTVHATHTATYGLTWELPWRRDFAGGQVSSYLDASIALWDYDAKDHAGNSRLAQAALVPSLRYRPDDGRSPWFVDAGVGATLMSKVYATQDKQFSTAFNFATHLAVGRSFGERSQHELSVRVEHFSNAGIKHPNPGENFLQIRYAYRFR